LQIRLYMEIGSDGVEIRQNSTNGTQFFVVKCKAMMPDFIGCAENVKPLLIIPGPKAPKHFDVYWWMIFNGVFIKYGPASTGVHQNPHHMQDLHSGEHMNRCHDMYCRQRASVFIG
jgi:hypothetical protein